MSGQRPKPKGYPQAAHTVGEHLKRCRLDLGLKQTEAAAMLGVCRATLANWEWNRAQPPVARMPAVIAFLGYDPHPDPKTAGDTQRELAVKLSMHRMSLGKIETGKERPSESMLERTREFLGALPFPHTVPPPLV